MNHDPGPLIVVMARPPDAADCKTRLAAARGRAEARRIYTQCLSQVLSVCIGTGWPVRITVAGHPLALAGLAATFSTDVELVRQQGNGLPERSAHEIVRGLADGYRPVTLVASDLWQLEADQVRWAVRTALTGRVAVVPSPDGGYGVLSATDPVPELTKLIMSDARTLDRLRHTLTESGRGTELCPSTVADIDDGADVAEYIVQTRG
ncbi:DUF2064 domain-containing protein [Saccharothrix sp. AJ9571]|nr:DUF2064 domain-containing protein [Saccharothrix sp. AJ9571]